MEGNGRAQVRILFRHLLGRTERNNKSVWKKKYLASGPRFEPGTVQTRSRIADCCAGDLGVWLSQHLFCPFGDRASATTVQTGQNKARWL